jgi:hypothetical protein
MLSHVGVRPSGWMGPGATANIGMIEQRRLVAALPGRDWHGSPCQKGT